MPWIDTDAFTASAIAVSIPFTIFVILSIKIFFDLNSCEPSRANEQIRNLLGLTFAIIIGSAIMGIALLNGTGQFSRIFYIPGFWAKFKIIYSILIPYIFSLLIMFGIYGWAKRKYIPVKTEEKEAILTWPVSLIIIFMILFLAFCAIIGWLFTSYLKKPELLFMIINLPFFAVYFIYIPYLRFSGKAKEIKDGEIFEDYRDLLKKSGIGQRRLWLTSTDKEKANGSEAGILQRLGGIFLDQSLVNSSNRDEIRSIIAHKICHIKKRHYLVSLLISLVFVGICWYFFLVGSGEIVFVLVVIYWYFFFTYIRRKQEYSADLYAARLTGAANTISSLEKMGRRCPEQAKSSAEQAKLNIPVIFKADESVDLCDTHPTLNKRIRHIQKAFPNEIPAGHKGVRS
ncbi:MAG: M48 family metalloprotease [Candidatus Eremiobacteraeota bacterium]|nr:M48 family metalloprotease [Candidatus Eremiobacteraeota bacterium]